MALLAKKNGIVSVSTWPMPINRSRGFDHARNDEGQCREQAGAECNDGDNANHVQWIKIDTDTDQQR